MFLRFLALLAACLLAAPSHAQRLPSRPLILSAAGAEPIELKHLSVSAEISGGMAETTVRMVFFNPNGRQLEGKLQFPLLDGQYVTAFALDIEANYYGNRQQVLAGATTLQVKLFTHFGTGRQKEQVVTLRLKDAGETVFVGEFTVGP